MSKRSLKLIPAGGDDMAFSTTDFCTGRVPVTFSFPLYPLLFDLRVIGLVVVDRVGGEGVTLDFGADGFGGGFGRLGACFSTTSVLCEPLVFLNVFAALKSGFLEADAVSEGGCGG